MTQIPNTREVSFGFKSRKVFDTDGKTVLGHTKKQPKLTLSLPVPTDSYLIDILSYQIPTQQVGEDGKPIPFDEETQLKIKLKNLIRDGVDDLIIAQAKEQLDTAIDSFGQDESKTISSEYIDWEKLTLESIALIPPSQRGATAISDEEWQTFFDDYLQVMVPVTGKPEDKIKKHIELFKTPTKIKTRKDLLQVLVDQLQIYKTSSQNLEDTAVQADRLESKFKKWLEEDEKLVAESL